MGFAEGVLWVDDSKATNSHAAAASLAAFESVVWVVGGLLKGTDVGPLVERHAGRLRGAVVIGVDRQPVVESFARHAPSVPVFEVDATETGEVMPEAVRLAAAVAREGDVVLLAPAAASMDQFTDYGDRGRRFAEAVRESSGRTRMTTTRPPRGRQGQGRPQRLTAAQRAGARRSSPECRSAGCSPPSTATTSCCSAPRSSWSRSAS